jgi:hypothetical protein
VLLLVKEIEANAYFNVIITCTFLLASIFNASASVGVPNVLAPVDDVSSGQLLQSQHSGTAATRCLSRAYAMLGRLTQLKLLLLLVYLMCLHLLMMIHLDSCCRASTLAQPPRCAFSAPPPCWAG